MRIPYINSVSKNIKYVLPLNIPKPKVKTPEKVIEVIKPIKPLKKTPPKKKDGINIPYVIPLSKKIVKTKSIIVK